MEPARQSHRLRLRKQLFPVQRWEPVISNSVPSMIPFWIRIKGLPLHYWQDDMVCRVGKEPGTLENHELTKTTARVQVSVDGLKPLIKELIIEFDSGEETSVTLEYEKLKYHCSVCFSLLHSKKKLPEDKGGGKNLEPDPKDVTN
ncbi:uncharacterized protein At4g02000-like [Brassica napus]|uniref:uncharacterized protein At4g02000-like n=1 Tax=Brassica napus TaxID=3708 RepID=UPI0006AA95B9|nr:uncharacterized protein At4g02000-like [Brassica napus]